MSAVTFHHHRRAALLLGGGLSALILGWLTVAALAFGTVFVVDAAESWATRQIIAGEFTSVFALWVVLGAMWCLALPVTAYLIGMSCAFFWHRMALPTVPEWWALAVLIVAVTPLVRLLGAPILQAILIAAPLAFVAMRRDLSVGLMWWPAGGWRHFFGFGNAWERATD